MQKKLELKYLSSVDANLIQALEDDCFDQHSRWSKAMIEDSVNTTTTRFFGAFLDGRMVGYCVYLDMVQELELLRICVSTSYQNSGIGYKLLSYSIKYLKDKLYQNALPTIETNYSIFLEVADNNLLAQKLYAKCGFDKICIRKNYYLTAGQSQDAIIMRLTI